MPEVRMLYEDIGILGTATIANWNYSIPMTKTGENDEIWEIELELTEGAVKFRSRNSWTQNWGGQSFPEGKAEYFGPDINVEPGNYKVRLDLNKETYRFIEIDK